MTVSASSPNTDNYYIGKGKVYIKMPDDDAYWDIGNVPEFEVTPTVDKLDHFSSRAGVKSKDRSVSISRAASLRMVMEEWTPRNLSLVLMGAVDDTTPATTTIDIFSLSSITCGIKFRGNNDIGPKWDADFDSVEFTPSNSINFISEEWAPLEITGEILYDDTNERFGVATAAFATAGPTGPTGNLP